ncbi:MAG TPA: hypothetical protein VFS23_34310, partial [Vicinamibacterales bacterium]|nr:hypothetical protein [Vicinamibacterales bacterium]
MSSSRTIPAFFLCLALLSLTVVRGSAQQEANRPANQQPAQEQPPQGQAPQGQAPQGQAPDGQAPDGQQPQQPTFRGSINFVRV